MNQHLPSDQLTIRPASFADIPCIQQVARHTWPGTYTHIIGGRQVDYMLALMYSTEALQQQLNNHYLFFLALLNDQVVGFAGIHFPHPQLCRLEKLYVVPGVQKTGAGLRLLHTVTGVAQARGAKAVQLNVNRENVAKHFYRKHGFEIIKEVDLDIGNGFFMNDYIMEKQL